MTKTLALAALLLAACGGSSGTTPGDDFPGADASPSDMLTCKSAALCTTYKVYTYEGTVPAPSGGTVLNGLYKLVYKVAPTEVHTETGYHDDLEAMMILGTSVHRVGFFDDDLGTLSTSGTKLKLQLTQNCNLGEDGSAATEVIETPYTATENALWLYHHVVRSDGVEWDELNAYARVNDPTEICHTAAATPTSPGTDSTKCTVTNCACDFAIEDTIPQCF